MYLKTQREREKEKKRGRHTESERERSASRRKYLSLLALGRDPASFLLYAHTPGPNMAFYIPPHRREPIPLPYIELSSFDYYSARRGIARRYCCTLFLIHRLSNKPILPIAMNWFITMQSVNTNYRKKEKTFCIGNWGVSSSFRLSMETPIHIQRFDRFRLNWDLASCDFF